MASFLQLPPPPDDYGYATTLLSAMGVLLLAVVGFIAREYLRYRNAQDDKRDAQWREAEALRVEARQRLDALIVSRFDQSDQNQADFEAGIRAEIDGIKRANEARDRDVFRLKEQYNPPKEGGK